MCANPSIGMTPTQAIKDLLCEAATLRAIPLGL